ncbi:hypothetical protein [Streptomyces sp. NPDC048643]|uniref:hypothetical protein n=1 Tax=Streptomyces sp. NPDC048643 TaxID=3155637 RepID=UPI003437C543
MTSPAFRPTHVVPQDGLPAWETPDPSRPTVPLDALLPVQLVDRLGDWGRVVCANGWSAWVDGRLLIGVPQVPPDATGPPARTADPRPLLARVEEALTEYRGAAEELAAGQLDGETFRTRTQGRRIGVVVDGESMWLYDAEHERWVYCDGARLSTFAAERTPTTSPPVPPEQAPEPRAPEQEQGGPASAGPREGHQPPGEPREQGREPEAPRVTGPEPGPEQAADRGRERDRGQGQEPEPTRLVGQEPEPTEGGYGEGDQDQGQGQEPTRLVGRGGAPEPTRLVGQEPEPTEGGYGEGDQDQGQGQEPEPTRLVGRGGEPAPTAGGYGERERDRGQGQEPEPTRLVGRGGAPEPTQVADRESERGQVADRDDERERRRAREREEEETRAVPEAAPGGHEPTRVVTFDDDGGRP